MTIAEGCYRRSWAPRGVAHVTVCLEAPGERKASLLAVNNLAAQRDLL